jgi:hypothetical protein
MVLMMTDFLLCIIWLPVRYKRDVTGLSALSDRYAALSDRRVSDLRVQECKGGLHGAV